MELTLQGKKVHIENLKLKINDILDFHAVNNELKIVKLSNCASKPKIISVVPSLDTSKCAVQTTTFSKYAISNLQNYEIITISKDLPFSQSRFCHNLILAKNFHIWSDYRNDINNFANTTGLIIKELQLLARAVIVLDKNNKVIYLDIAPEISKEIDYQKLLTFIKSIN